MIDSHHAVLFGGNCAPRGYASNDVYIMDLFRMVSMVKTEFVIIEYGSGGFKCMPPLCSTGENWSILQ